VAGFQPLSMNSSRFGVFEFSAAAASGVEKTLGYSRNVYDIANGTGVQLFELLSATASELRGTTGSVLEELTSSTVIGGSSNSALKSMLSTSEAVIEGLTRTAKQSIQLSDAVIKTTSDSAAQAIKSLAQKG